MGVHMKAKTTTDPKLLYRVTKRRWVQANKWHKRETDGDFWYVDKYEVDYRTRAGDVRLAQKYAETYSNQHYHYSVFVEVACTPRFYRYDSVKGPTEMDTVVNMLKARQGKWESPVPVTWERHGEPSSVD
jgi:hypothetical protein